MSPQRALNIRGALLDQRHGRIGLRFAFRDRPGNSVQ